MQTKRVKIVYYSGTGGTQRVAKCFEKLLKDSGYEVAVQHLNSRDRAEKFEHDWLILLYAVHACNAPQGVYSWIENTESVNNIQATVISVSGGGEVSPNTACRLHTIKKLEKKGYKVTYEKMLVMPSNWIVATRPPLDRMLFDVLPKKVSRVISDVENGVTRRTKPHLIDRFFSCIGEFEKFGAISFGKKIKVSEDCTGCGLCEKNCPSGNITIKSGKPEFSNKCHLCLNCIYGCPQKALKAGTGKFVVIKEGYDLKKLDNMEPVTEEVDIEKIAKGYVWSGIRKYLLEKDY